MPSGHPTPAAVRQRIVALAVGEGRTNVDTARRITHGMDGGVPYKLTGEDVRRLVRKARADGEADARPAQLAGRMLRLVERELAVLEAKRGPTDLERLDKLAGTLRKLEPLRPSRSETDGRKDLGALFPETPSDSDRGSDGNGSPDV